MSAPSLLSVDEIVNYGIGTELLNEFMGKQHIAIKKDGHHYYLYETGTGYTQEEWNNEICDNYKYVYGDTVYQDGTTWGNSVRMIKEGTSDGYKYYPLGNLKYNVPTSATESEIDANYYEFKGDSLEDDNGTYRNVSIYVPIKGALNEITTSQAYQVLAEIPLFAGQTYDLSATGTQSASYSTTMSRTFGFMADVKYKIKDTVGTDEGVDDSVSESLKAEFEFDFSETNDQEEAGDDTINVSGAGEITNTSNVTLTLMVVTPTYYSSSQYEIEGQLASAQGLSSAYDDTNIIQYYDQQDGEKSGNYRIKNLNSVGYVLETAQNALRTAAQIQDGQVDSDSSSACADGSSSSDSLSTLADNIDPSTGKILTTGGINSYAPNTKVFDMWVYNKNANCYASSFTKATAGNFDDCKCDRNQDAQDSGLTVDDNCESSDNSSSKSARSARSKEPTLDSELFTLSNLRNMHKIEPEPHDTISLEIDGESVDFSVGSLANTFRFAFAIGGNARDWHKNKSRGEYGGSILHKGSDHYFGNTGKDFVSSRSVGGATSIRTKDGDDTVLIDVKKIKKFTPGRTYLGKGNDTFFYLGSKKDLGEIDSRHENLFTGKGKDTIIVKKNAKLHVEDFNLKKDTLQMNFDEYESRIVDHTMIFTSEEGGSVVLRDVLKGFTGAYDSLPFG